MWTVNGANESICLRTLQPKFSILHALYSENWLFVVPDDVHQILFKEYVKNTFSKKKKKSYHDNYCA